MREKASDLAHRLAREAEAVCRHLFNGRREGGYWLVGDAHNTLGRSMFVRLKESPKRPAGKWTDAATGEGAFAETSAPSRADRLATSRTAALRYVAAGDAHTRRDVSP